MRINKAIQAKEVRLINSTGEQVGIVTIEQAILLANETELDLVEVVPTAKPPVCKIMDFSKYKYELSKKQVESRKKNKQIQVKEVKFRPVTYEGDYNIKLRSIKKFIVNDNNKVKVTMKFRGREIVHKEIGIKILKRIEEDLKLEATIEQFPKLEGKQMIMILAPKKK